MKLVSSVGSLKILDKNSYVNIYNISFRYRKVDSAGIRKIIQNFSTATITGVRQYKSQGFKICK